MIDKNTDKIKQIKRCFKKSEIKDLNNIPGGEQDFIEGINLMLYDASIDDVPKEKVLRFKEGIPVVDDPLQDISNIVNKIEECNSLLFSREYKTSDLLQDIIDSSLLLVQVLKKLDIYTDKEAEYPLMPINIEDDIELADALIIFSTFTKNVITLTKKVIDNEDYDSILSYAFIYYTNISVNADSLIWRLKKEESNYD